MSQDNPSLQAELAKLAEQSGQKLVVVKDGRPESVILPIAEYQDLQRQAAKVKSSRPALKGVILAGGNATRLRPLTYVTNKHLLPVYDRPMIYYPLQSMAAAGVKDVLITTNPHHAADFINLLGNGEEFGLRLHYAVQQEAGGLSQAVALAEAFAENSPILVILGDNIFDTSLQPAIANFLDQDGGARIFAQKHDQPEHYGVVEIGESGRVISIEEKPSQPKSSYIQLGIYLYNPDVFSLIHDLKPSARGELEITDLNNLYLSRNQLFCEVWEKDNWWIDAGTSHLELFKANVAAAERVLTQKQPQSVKNPLNKGNLPQRVS